MAADEQCDHRLTAGEQEGRDGQDGQPPAPFGATFWAIGLALRARRARSATIALDATGTCIVLALLAETSSPSWPASLHPEERASFIARVQREQQNADTPLRYADNDSHGWLQQLHTVGCVLDERGGVACTILVDLERGVVAAADARGPVIAPRPQIAPAARQIFHPGQQAMYQKGAAPPCAVTVKRLGKHQIHVAFEDGTEQAIHRKWLTPLDWPAPPSARGDAHRSG